VVGRLAGERLPALAILGAALIVAGTVVSELKLRGRRTAPDEDADQPAATRS
jgi:drug/metabolite transporter (DMT)-like permease